MTPVAYQLCLIPWPQCPMSDCALRCWLCRFLSANSLYSTDTIYPGFVRIMVHIDAKKAAVWKKVTVGGSQYLQIKINRDAGSQSTIGWYLAEPPNSVRDELTNYLAVTPDISRAMPVSFKATE